MKNALKKTIVSFRLSASLFPAVILSLLSFAGGLAADAPPALTTIRSVGTNSEGFPTYTLEWDSAPNTLYRLQSRTGFESNTAWETFDLARPGGTRGIFRVNDDKSEAGAESIKRSFFQVLMPLPEIFGVEPALIGTNGGTVYLFGQCLGTNPSVRIGGFVFTVTPTTVTDTYVFTVTADFTALGTYDVEVLDGTNVIATASKLFSVTGQPTPVGEAVARLLEVPEEPPASPRFKQTMATDDIGDARDYQREPGKIDFPNLRLASGELQVRSVDLSVPGRGLDFEWTRTYRSRTGTDTPMGHGWSHGYDIQAFLEAGGIVVVLDGTGRGDRYFLQSNGVYTADELFNEVTISNGVCVVTFPDTGKWEFNSLSNAIAPGKISRCVDRNGNELTFHYDSSSRLSEIVDTLDRTNRVSYDAVGRIASVSDFTGRRCTYTYWRNGQPGGGDGDLRSVTSPPVIGTPNGNDFPLGKTTIYTYSHGLADARLNHNLLSITDPNGQTWLTVEYSPTLDPLDVNFDRVLSVQRGTSSPSMFTYIRQTPAASNRWAVTKTICNDPVGNVTIDWFDSLNRRVIHRDLAARATPGAVITEDKLPKVKLRLTDPDFWETRYEWNLDSLCTRVIYPRSNSTEIVYQRAQDHNSSRSNKSRRSDGNPRVIRERACCADLDGDGANDLVTRMSHDPRFGSPGGFNGGYNGGFNGGLHFSSGPRQSTSIDSAKVIMDRDTGRSKGFGFVIWSSDPRGNVDTSEYDAQGNCTRLTHIGRLLDGSDAPVTRFEYNPHGQLTATVHPADPNGYSRRDEFSYYDNGEQTGYLREWTVDAQGPVVNITTYEWDADGDLVSTTDAKGHQNKFHNNSLNQRVRQESPPECAACIGITTDYFYDANDNLVRTEHENRDALGVLNTNNPTWTTLSEYDVLNRRTLIAHEATHTLQQRFVTNRLVYDGNDNVIETHSPEAVNGNQPGNTVSYEYDTRGFLWRQTSGPFTALACTDEFDYDENGNRVRNAAGTQDPTPATYSWSFDAFDRCVTATDPLGNVSIFAYDANDNLVYARHDGQTNDVPGGIGNRRLSEMRYEYDSLDRLVTQRESFFDVFTELPLLDGEATTSWSYAPNGACRSVTDDNGRTTRYSYDTLGRLAVTTDPKTNTMSYAYDPNGNVLSVTQSDGSDVAQGRQTFVTQYEYDALDRCVVDFDNAGNTNRYRYDSRGNLTQFTDPRGNDVCYIYDGLSRRVGDISYVGPCDAGITISTMHVEYDDNSRRTATTNANGHVTRYTYDALNRLVATTSPDNTVDSLIWSPRSNLTRRTDPNGTVVRYSYDANDRLVRKDIAPGSPMISSQTTFETYQYDGLSRCVMASNDVSMLDFGYDSMGNLEKAKQDCIAAAMTFDGVGNRLSITYPSGRIVTSTYDALDQVASLSTSPGGGLPSVSLMTFAYDGPGRPGRISRGNGINTRLVWNGLQNPANAPGDFGWQQVSGVNHQVPNGVTIDRRLSVYDRNQNKLLRQQVLPFAGGVPALTTNIMAYDALNRMTSFARNRASTAYTKTFALDGNGNRQSVSSNGVVEIYTMDATLPEPADFQMDQYTGTPFGTFEYDRNGNRVFIPGPVGGTQFTYDYANRLVEVARSVGPAFVPIVSFTYDALGRRISKTKYPDAPALPVTTQYLLDPDSDDDGILEERINGAVQFFAVWPHMHKPGTHVRIAAAGEIYYAHADEMGSVLALTDQNTNVVERYDYDAYGSPRFLTSDGLPLVGSDGKPATESLVGNPFLFRGMIWDGETGLYLSDSDHTYIDPSAGRSIARTGRNPQTGRGLSTVFDDNPWSARASGDPIHGVDVKLGLSARASGDPVHGVDVKLGLRARERGSGLATGRRSYSPRDAASGLSTGKRQHRDAASGLATGKRQHRDAASGLATGKRQHRDAASGLSTGKRQHSPRDPATGLSTGKRIHSPRDAASGLATGKRSHAPSDRGSGLATGKRSHAPRDAASGLATGKRQHSPRDPASGLPTGRRIHSPRDAASGLATGKRQHKPFTIISPSGPGSPFASSSGGGAVIHWQLEVRVDRIEMK